MQSGPFSCSVWDSRLVKTTEIKAGVIGKPVEFQSELLALTPILTRY